MGLRTPAADSKRDCREAAMILTMYTSFFGLAEKPFAITPDPRYLYLSERHTEALAHLLYGIDDAGGFIQLTGEVGTGKTTLIRSLLAQLPAHADVALILNPRVTPEEFLRAICDELDISLRPLQAGSVKNIVDALNAFLLDAHARGRRVVVLVDEAQQLSVDVLEQVRLLTNLETATHKLLQIILVGQPELRDLLARNDLRQLAQRITGRYHLTPLAGSESAAYIRHRLSVAGATTDIFSERALAVIDRQAAGVPRLMNVIADRALLGAYVAEKHQVTAGLVRKAAAEIRGGSESTLRPRHVFLIGAGLVALMLAAVSTVLVTHRLTKAIPAVAPQQTATQVRSSEALIASAGAPSLHAFLTQHANDSVTDGALKTLFGLWGLSMHEGSAPCDDAAAAGYECVSKKGTFAELQRLNRPVILSLSMPDGVEHQVVLSSWLDQDVTLTVGDQQVKTGLPELSQYWFGDFLLLWHPPVASGHLIKPGLRGTEIRWLRRALASDSPTYTASDSDVYDTALQHEVETFQRAHHVAVDGIVGQETLLLLDAKVAEPGTPVLVGSEH